MESFYDFRFLLLRANETSRCYSLFLLFSANNMAFLHHTAVLITLHCKLTVAANLVIEYGVPVIP